MIAGALILLLSLATAGDPTPVVRELLAAEAAGDVSAASRLWVAQSYTPRQLRHIQKRCIRLVDADVRLVSHDDVNAIVETTETVLVAASLPGGVDRLETSHSRFTMTHTAAGWRVAKRDSLEALLVEQLAQAHDAAERARLFAASTELHDEALVELAAELVRRLVNERRLDDAIQLSRDVSDLAWRLGDPRSIADATSVRSIIERNRVPANFEHGFALANEAVAFGEAGGDADALARALVRLSRAQSDVHQDDDPTPLQRTLAVAGYLEDASPAAHAATQYARYLEARWHRREAFHYAELASRYAKESDDVSAEITASLILGGAFLWYGDPALTRRHMQRAYELSLAAGYEPVAASALRGIADTLEPGERRKVIDQALPRFSGISRIPLLELRVHNEGNTGDYAAAERDLQEIIELEKTLGVSSRDNRAGSMAWLRLGQRRYEEAAAYIDKARQSSADPYEIDRLDGRVLRCLGRPEEAIARLETAVASASKMSASIADPGAAPFGGSMNEDEEALLEILVEQGRILRALEVSEATKARLLRRSLAGGGVSATVMSAVDRRHEEALETRIRTLNQALVAGKGDSPAIMARIEDARAELLDFRQRALALQVAPGEAAPLTGIPELPQSLDDVTILSFAQTSNEVYVFAIEPRDHGRRAISARIVPLRMEELQEKIARYVSFVEQRNLRADALGEELYGLLLAPVEASVKRARRLCIIPHRTLWQVPFHALGRNGRRLIEHVAVFYAPSIAVLADAESRRKLHENGPESLLAFANPLVGTSTAALYRAFDRDAPLGSIPETEWEVRAIAKLYGTRSRVRIGADAGEGALKREAPHYDVLHIAAHGLVQDNAPMFSSLVLSSDSAAEDGLLEAREIIGLDLGAETVVLSACDTGKPAELGTSDPVVGWSWAFLAAGCRTTVVSQWKAQSAATAQLMIEFHRRLSRGASEADALRGAQLALRRDPRYRHPFYWAPFIVVGAP